MPKVAVTYNPTNCVISRRLYVVGLLNRYQSYQARAVRLAAPNPRLIPLAALGCPRLYQFQKKLQSQPSMKATIFPMKAGL